MQRMGRNRHRHSGGFTIIELLIATVVFSVVLLIVSVGILQISRVYYKGVTQSNTQNTARNIIDTISQAIQFTGDDVTPTAIGPAPGNSYAFCAGGQQFSYTLGYQVDDAPSAPLHQSYHALVQAPASGCAGAPAQNVRSNSVTGRELVAPHMRLANLVVESVGTNVWHVQVRVVYGDDDLLNNPTASTANCQGGQAGSHFCAVSELSTVVVKRVE